MDAIEYEEIRQLLGRYNMAIDLGDTTGWAACFTPDGVFECTGLPDGSPLGGRHEGTEALVAYATTHYG
jgi:ketosteroid isomerase-like protein